MTSEAPSREVGSNAGLADHGRSVQEMKDRVCELKRMSAAINEERQNLERKIAEATAVWRIGQRVLWRTRGEYEVTSIQAGYGFDRPKYIGRKVLKSGDLGQSVELWGELKAANAELCGAARR